MLEAVAKISHDPMLPQLYRVQHVRHEIADTITLELAPEDGSDTPPFSCGQFNMLYVFGVGEIPISISSDPRKRKSLLHTTRAVGMVSRAICALKTGDTIGVRGPFGKPWPVTQAISKDVVIVAGGIGLAPLRSTVYMLAAQREQYGKIALLYGARTPRDILYAKELEQWRARFEMEIAITVDHATSAWHGSVGVVTRLIPRATFEPTNTIAMLCGPEIMMRFTAAELEKREIGAEHIFLSMERNMKCALGFCGHCQYLPYFVCKDGPVFQYSQVRDLLFKREI